MIATDVAILSILLLAPVYMGMAATFVAVYRGSGRRRI